MAPAMMNVPDKLGRQNHVALVFVLVFAIWLGETTSLERQSFEHPGE
jgi:hypothetical protein